MDAGLSAASECPACFQELGENRKPYSLPCGHTLCQLCVHSLVRISSTQFSCPLQIKCEGGWYHNKYKLLYLIIHTNSSM